MKSLLILATTLLLVACGPNPLVRTDFDPAVDLSGYDTYAWRQEPPVSNPLMKQRLVAAIDAELAAHGWSRVAESDADVALVGNVATREEQTLERFYSGPDWGGWGWQGVGSIGPRYQTTRVYSYTVGTLVLDMFDTKTRRAVWRATAEGTVPDTPAKTTEAIQIAARKMFAGFPPGRAAGH